MTAPISSNSTTTTLLQSSANGVLNKDDFLRLLVSQLKHQDPLNPMDGTEFASQLAEFSSLEQLIELNKATSAQSQSDAMTQVALHTSLGASLIGHQVLGYGNEFQVTGSGNHAVEVDVAGAGSATIEVLDEFGNVVASQALGGVEAGQQQLEFKLDNGLAPGVYHYRVTVTDADGRAVTVQHFTRGLVEGVFFDQGGVSLRLDGGLRIDLNSLAEIEPAKE
jgi:flagellar basal-body rod modification protein FlgD